MICPECKEEGCIRTLTKETWRFNLEGCTRRALVIARKERDELQRLYDEKIIFAAQVLRERDAALARVKELEAACAPKASVHNENCLGTCYNHIDGLGYHWRHTKNQLCVDWCCSMRHHPARPLPLAMPVIPPTKEDL